uniref:uncharacterized protein LOC120325659 isoform X1 n=1 Tax=Styela clava TaxID=7725 RepID=UPI00193A62B0|nr:uncharacterized protein LOC120325659 isoform X1 [Styela clava]
MGFKIIINRLLCVPCGTMLWIHQRMNASKEQTLRFAKLMSLLVVSTVFVLLTMLLISQSFIFSPVKRNVEKSNNGHFSVDESFLLLYRSGITRTNTFDDTKNKLLTQEKFGDKFAQANFLHLKLQHLVALSYLSSPFQSSSVAKSDRKTPPKEDDFNIFGNINFTFLVNELNVVLKVQNFYLRQWGCRELKNLKFPAHVVKTQHGMVGNVAYGGKNVALQTCVADVDELMAAKCGSADSDTSRENTNRCFLLKNRRMLQQYLFLQELSHPNIVKVYGVCIQTGSNPTASSFTLAKEAGLIADIGKLKMQPWNHRLKVAFDLANLAVYLAKSPIGSIRLESWAPNKFIITQVGSSTLTVKLSDFDQAIVLTEKSCNYDRDCSIGKISSAVKCMHGLCKDYNEKFNLYNLYISFLSPVLEDHIPSRLSSEATNLFNSLRNLEYNATVLVQLLKSLKPSMEEIADGAHIRGDPDNLLLQDGLHPPDGLQVDSWEQHESHIAINEVDFNQDPVNQNNIQPVNNVDSENNNAYKDTFGYKKIDNADFPGRYDYYCPHSKAEWGCVVSLRKLEDAAKKCDADAKCEAFVTMPHLRKEGWIIVILKSDNTRAVDHAGTTVYIKPSDEDDSKNNKDYANGGGLDSSVVKLCLQDLVQAQESMREKREKELMKPCGWEGMSDSKLQSIVLDATVADATKFKPSRGKMAVGGQMNIMLETSSKPTPALFLAKKGPEEFHLAQLTTYHLDRMLGLYKILPAFLRTLTEQEMTDAGFPVDVGGNQFDMFRQLKNADRSLSGTIVPTAVGKVGVEHYISVPKLGQVTNAVTPFSRRQYDDLEYLLLMWLASLPLPTKGHPSLQRHLIHIKADEAFKSEPSPVVLSYFYNCHFPRIAVDVLRNLRTAHCNFGDQLIARVQTSYPDLQVSAFSFKLPVADIATRNANRLLEVVDLCVGKFGDNVVLYDS